MITVITFGTYDLFHIGHLNILKRAAGLGNYLVVGVSSDALNFKKKKKYPEYDENCRIETIRSLSCVDEVFMEDSLEEKRSYILNYKADILVMGDDWAGKFDEFSDICSVVYFSRTPNVSTTATVNAIRGAVDQSVSNKI